MRLDMTDTNVLGLFNSLYECDLYLTLHSHRIQLNELNSSESNVTVVSPSECRHVEDKCSTFLKWN